MSVVIETWGIEASLGRYLLYICRFLLWAQSPRYFVLPSDEGARENNVRGPGTTLKIGRYTIFPYDTSIRGQRWLETCFVLNFPPFFSIFSKNKRQKISGFFFPKPRKQSPFDFRRAHQNPAIVTWIWPILAVKPWIFIKSTTPERSRWVSGPEKAK